MRGKKAITAIFLAFGLSIFGDSAALETGSSANNPQVLIFTTIDVRYLADSIEFWGKGVPVHGFILNYVADWWSEKKNLDENAPDLRKLNKRGATYGVDSNFVRVALGYGHLPSWTDDVAWEKIESNFRNIAAFIRDTGTKGIALDTEPYQESLFDPSAARFNSVKKEMLRRKVFQRGRQIMESLTSTFPDIEVFMLPEGSLYWFNPGEGSGEGYELWMDFFDGMASVKNRKGIVIGAERTYQVLARDSLARPFRLIDRTMRQHAADPGFWMEKCSIAVGMWPLGKTYSDKSSNYSSAEFDAQFLQAVSLSPRYVWIYDHGVAWFRMTADEVARYTAGGRWIWGKEYQTIPTDPAIREYYDVIKRYRNSIKGAFRTLAQ